MAKLQTILVDKNVCISKYSIFLQIVVLSSITTPIYYTHGIGHFKMSLARLIKFLEDFLS